MSPNNEFGSYLRELREARNTSVNQLAKQIGISGAEMSRIERGVRQKINPYLLRKLAPVLNVDIHNLMVKAGFLPSAKPLLRTTNEPRIDEFMSKATQLTSSQWAEVESLLDSILNRSVEPEKPDTDA